VALKVILAGEMGMCFGVKEALETARAVDAPAQVTIHGELVHNEHVTSELRARGFATAPEHARATVPATPLVLITAHGVSARERERLRHAGKELIDTTCPLVTYAHHAARTLASEGWFVVVIGKACHVEVKGLVGDLERFAVIADASAARPFGEKRLGVVCQTTTAPDHAERALAAIRVQNPDSTIRVIDTICGPTRNRQLAAEALLDRVEALVVVGGKHSNNTLALVALAHARGLPALHVQGAGDLDPAWFEPYATVGLTAGTSTLDETIAEVHRALLEIGTAHLASGLQLDLHRELASRQSG